MSRYFLICPVRNASSDATDRIAAWVASMELDGHEVYWPARDTDQDDQVGARICRDNAAAIRSADAVFVWYTPTSQGTLFDLGIAFGLQKRIVLANRTDVEACSTSTKSFANMLLHIDGNQEAMA